MHTIVFPLIDADTFPFLPTVLVSLCRHLAITITCLDTFSPFTGKNCTADSFAAHSYGLAQCASRKVSSGSHGRLKDADSVTTVSLAKQFSLKSEILDIYQPCFHTN